MHKLINQTLLTIDKHKLIPLHATVLVALSGGFDSTCLLLALHELARIRGFTLSAAHINHMLRDNAGRDAQYCKQLCDSLSITLHDTSIDVAAYASTHKLSIEMAGRILRYDYLQKVADTLPQPCVIATAHNANDNAESIVMHILRGSGISGLKGIGYKNGNIVRPILDIPRLSIEAYLHDRGITPMQDESNQSDCYTRNDLRLNIMPELYKRGALSTLNNLSEIARQEDDFMESQAAAAMREVYKNNKLTKAFNNLHIAIKRRILRTLLDCNNMTLQHIDAIIEMQQKNYGGKLIQLPNKQSAKLINGEILIEGTHQ